MKKSDSQKAESKMVVARGWQRLAEMSVKQHKTSVIQEE
jgi:hypothetical protein